MLCVWVRRRLQHCSGSCNGTGLWLNTPIQSISLHSSFAHPSIHTIKAAGRVGWRERCCDRESICFCRNRSGEGAEEEEERECIVPSQKKEELQREREGREESALLSNCNTFSLSHWQGVCSAPSHSVCLSVSHTHTHTVVVLQRHHRDGPRHQCSADIIGQQWQS